MNERTYEKITRPIINYKYGLQILNIVNSTITAIVYALYPLLLISLALNRDIRFWRALLVPGISFNIVTIFRKYYNAPRPYEVLDITPMIKKDTRGKSFPSRHVFSIYVIATTFYYINPPIGLALLGAGVVLAAIRVLGGVHFPKDVLVGAIAGIVSAVIGFLLW